MTQTHHGERKRRRKKERGKGERKRRGRRHERKKSTLEKRKLRGARHFIGTPEGRAAAATHRLFLHTKTVPST